MLSQQTVRDTVTQELLDLLMESSLEEVVLESEQLHALGVNSLLLARLIVQLNAKLDSDPFAQGAAIADVRTISDLVTIYEQALQVKAPADV